METNQMETLLGEAAQEPIPVEPLNDDAQLRERAQELITQARTIREITRVDVLAIYNTDVEVRTRVLSGAWDFVDLYKALKPAPIPPAPVRNANGGMVHGGMNVSAMTDDQFTRLNAMLQKGGKVDMH